MDSQLIQFESGVEWFPVPINHEDLEFLRIRVLSVVEIAQGYGIPLASVGEVVEREFRLQQEGNST